MDENDASTKKTSKRVLEVNPSSPSSPTKPAEPKFFKTSDDTNEQETDISIDEIEINQIKINQVKKTEKPSKKNNSKKKAPAKCLFPNCDGQGNISGRKTHRSIKHCPNLKKQIEKLNRVRLLPIEQTKNVEVHGETIENQEQGSNKIEELISENSQGKETSSAFNISQFISKIKNEEEKQEIKKFYEYGRELLRKKDEIIFQKIKQILEIKDSLKFERIKKNELNSEIDYLSRSLGSERLEKLAVVKELELKEKEKKDVFLILDHLKKFISDFRQMLIRSNSEFGINPTSIENESEFLSFVLDSFENLKSEKCKIVDDFQFEINILNENIKNLEHKIHLQKSQIEELLNANENDEFMLDDIIKTNNKLQNINDSLTQSNEFFKNEMESTKEELELSMNCQKNELEDMKDQLNELQLNFKRLSETNQILMDEKKVLFEENEDLKSSIRKNEKLASNLLNKICTQSNCDHTSQEFDKLVQELNSKILMLNESKREAINFQLDNTELKLKIERREVEIQKLNDEVAIKNSCIDDLKNENERLEKSLSSKTQNEKSYEKRLELLLSQENNFKTRIEKLNSELCCVRQEYDDEFKRQSDDKRRVENELKININNFKKNLEISGANLTKCATNLKNCQQEIKNQSDYIKDLKKENERISNCLVDSENKLLNCQSICLHHEKDKEKLLRSTADLEKEVTELNSKIDELHSTNDLITKEKSDIKTSLMDLLSDNDDENLKKKYEDLQQELIFERNKNVFPDVNLNSSLEKQLKDLEAKYYEEKQHRINNQQLADSFEQVKSDLDNSKKQFHEQDRLTEKSNKEIDRLETEVASLKQQIRQFHVENQVTDGFTEIYFLKKQNKDLQDLVEFLRTDKIKLEENICSIRNQYEQERIEFNFQLNQKNAFENFKFIRLNIVENQLDDLNKKYSTEQQQHRIDSQNNAESLKKIEDELNICQKQLQDQLNLTQNTNNDKIGLETQNLSLKQQIDQLNLEEKTLSNSLQQVKSDLNDSQKQFHEQVRLTEKSNKEIDRLETEVAPLKQQIDQLQIENQSKASSPLINFLKQQNQELQSVVETLRTTNLSLEGNFYAFRCQYEKERMEINFHFNQKNAEENFKNQKHSIELENLKSQNSNMTNMLSRYEEELRIARQQIQVVESTFQTNQHLACLNTNPFHLNQRRESITSLTVSVEELTKHIRYLESLFPVNSRIPKLKGFYMSNGSACGSPVFIGPENGKYYKKGNSLSYLSDQKYFSCVRLV